uniref:Band 7 domain-containing protein n=1 Tax=Haptolina brevifila TaxID=156173 RepID=A0A7S2CFH1_9EUKA
MSCVIPWACKSVEADLFTAMAGTCCCPCFIATSTGTVKIIETFGAFSSIARPGLSCVIPCINYTAGTISMRLQQIEVECETKTKDNVFVTIRAAVQYKVLSEDDDIKNAHYRLTNPKKQVEAYVYDVVRATVPKIELDNVFTTKDEISQTITDSLKTSMRSFGYEIRGTPITDIDPDRTVKHAMNEINKMKRLRVAAEDEGEAVKIRAVKEAEAEAARTEIQAKADAEAKYLGGQGISRQRQAIMEGLRESVNAFKEEVQGVDAKTVLDLMIVTQYFDMMKDVGGQSKSNAVFLNHSPGALEDLAGAVSKGFMSGLPAAPGFAQPMGR